MLATLQMASFEQAYVLTDMSTFLFNQQNLNLVILARGDERLFNPYGVIAVNPSKVENVNFEGAMAFFGSLQNLFIYFERFLIASSLIVRYG